ncbi:Glycine--tRNA ligase [subsurface metagenome]
MGKQPDTMEKLTSLAKRRGFIFQSSEIYGGLGSTWDYGPLGVELKRNVRNKWWRDVVTARQDVVGMDAAILMHPRVWEASGHVAQFHDPWAENKLTNKRYRVDHLLEAQTREVLGEISKSLLDTPLEGELDVHTITALTEAIMGQGDAINLNSFGILADGKKADWTLPRQFNLMFKTHIGPVEDNASVAYLRPETAQGIFVNFLNVQTTARAKLPFGIAQMGKAFRNEITTGNFLFRTREFEQMELEYFVQPDETAKWLDYWSQVRLEWFVSLGIRKEKLRLRPHGEDELAHYSAACYDVEYEFPFGWGELEGIADRGTFDLDQHQEYSGKKLTYFDPQTNEHMVPAVVESSAGVDRTVLTVLTDAYHEEEIKGETRVVLRLSPQLAPITVAVFPLVNKEGMPEIAEKLVDDLRGDFAAFYDAGGSIGRRYRRQDEAGTPFGITVDGQTTEDQTVTIRDRDTLAQDRVAIEQVAGYLREKLES